MAFEVVIPAEVRRSFDELPAGARHALETELLHACRFAERRQLFGSERSDRELHRAVSTPSDVKVFYEVDPHRQATTVLSVSRDPKERR